MANDAPAIILHSPQLGENIGAAARAMANFGLSDLRLVNPRDGWPNPRAITNASGADDIIASVRLFQDLESAIADLNFVYATTARRRDMVKPVTDATGAAAHALKLAGADYRTGYLFGRERWGLENDAVIQCDEILTLPVDPEFASLNVAQAVIVCAYEWRKQAIEGQLAFSEPAKFNEEQANKEDWFGLFSHLEDALDEAGFFYPQQKRAKTVRNIRSALHRAQLTESEIRMFRGIIHALSTYRAGKSDENRLNLSKSKAP